MKKQKKTARIDMRVVPELNDRAKELAAQVSKSRNLLIEDLIWTAVLSPDRFFVVCPTCKVPIFDKERIPIIEGQSKVECSNGHTYIYDFELEILF